MVPSTVIPEEKADGVFTSDLAPRSRKAVLLSVDTVAPSLDSLCCISNSTSSNHVCSFCACLPMCVVRMRVLANMCAEGQRFNVWYLLPSLPTSFTSGH